MPLAGHTVEEADVKLIATAVTTLKEMVATVHERQPVAPAADAVRELHALAGRLQPPRKPKEKRVMRDDIDAELLPVFLEEAQELVPQIAGDLRAWKASPADQKVADSVKRALHTLKGSARMAGAIRLGELTHLMESRIEFGLEAGDGSAGLFEELQAELHRPSADVEELGPAAAPARACAPPPPPAGRAA